MTVSYTRSGPGIALIMTLSIILFMSIALMRTFENRNVEVAHLENTIRRFQAESISRSVLRAILIAIKTKGLVFIINNKNYWSQIPFPLRDDQYFQIERMKPVDHYFNINKEFKANDPRVDIFINIINSVQNQKGDLAVVLDDELHPVMSAINDWIDGDTEQDEAFLYDYEQYPHQDLEYYVKNRAFDRLSELKIVPPFRELNISKEDIEKRFRVFGGDEFIDINLAESTEIEDFLQMYKDVEAYPNIYDNRAALADIITATEETEEESSLADFLSGDPRFPLPLEKRGDSRWEKELALEGITLTPKEKALFKGTTDYLEISYSVFIGNTTIKVNSLLNVLYTDKTKNVEIKKIAILTYTTQ